MWYPEWKLNQQNRICFVQVDAGYTEVAGLGVVWDLFISKNGGAFAPSTGVKSEISHGWYSYLATAAEADTVGPVSIYITSAFTITQNLEYVVNQRNSTCIVYTYTATEFGTGFPIPSADVWVTTDIAGANVIWNGTTDALGVARDNQGDLPCLDAGDYFFWVSRVGWTPTAWPDLEHVS